MRRWKRAVTALVSAGTVGAGLAACAPPPLPGSPFGFLDVVEHTTRTERESAPRYGFSVRGWAIDPDAPAPIEVQIYADGRYVASARAELNRPDVGAAHPGAGPHHGFDLSTDRITDGAEVCAYAINVGPGADVQLGCATAHAANPFGAASVDVNWLDGIRIRGYASDPDSRDPVEVVVTVGGQPARTVRATGGRPYGVPGSLDFDPSTAARSFDVTIPAPDGLTRVEVVARNIGPGTDTLLWYGPAYRNAGLPFGEVDVVDAGHHGGVRVAGWAADPSEPTTAVTIEVEVRGTGPAGSVQATADRPHAAATAHLPDAGPNHGFEVVVPVEPGRHTLCVYANDPAEGHGGAIRNGLGCAEVQRG